MPDNTRKLRDILETINVPEGLIRELESKSLDSQAAFLDTIQNIIQNEVVNLITSTGRD